MIKVAGLWHCVGRGGADGHVLSIAKYSQMLKFTGVMTSSDQRLSPMDLKRAKKWAGYPGIGEYHERRVKGPRVKGVTYHKSGTEAVLAAVEGADVVLSWGFPLDKIAHLIDIPIIDNVQGVNEWASKIARANAEHVDARIVVNQSIVSEIYEGRYSATLIHNGCDPMRALPSIPDARHQLRSAWKIDEDTIVVLQIQRMTADKNACAGVQAMNALKLEKMALELVGAKPGPKVHLVLCGSGPAPEEKMVRESIERFAPDEVSWVDDSWTEPGNLYAMADCFLLASESEGWSLAMMEAMFAGLPVIATANRAVNEFQAKHGNCLTTVSLNPTSIDLAAAIKHSQSEPGEIRAERAYRAVKHNYTMAVVTGKYEAIIEQVVARHRLNKRLPKINRVPIKKNLSEITKT